MMKEHVFVSAIIYARNNEKEISKTLESIDTVLNKTFINYEIVIVNDFSEDKTLQIIRNTIPSLRGNIIVINLSRKHGVENAMMAGLNKSMGDFVYEFDSAIIDYNIDLIPQLYKKAVTGFDIVSASTELSSSFSKLFYKVINRISYLDLDLGTERIRLVTRRALNAMLCLKEKVRYRKALYAYTGYAKAKVEFLSTGNYPQKKLNRENVALALDVLVSFSNFGLRISHYLSFLFFFFSIFMLGYSVYNYVFNRNVVEGWTTIMILISTGFAGLFFIIGMLGEYISRILIESQNRPFYSTKSVELYKEKPGAKNNAEAEVAVTNSI
ncbi:glycosyltransferase [Paenibacillus mesotrionivorans]|uniref:Glycosyltransferase n=1 Tax=Paenibacillus mesotrionivorans TaxID=3160968 RepID=A0ACC7NVA9_9BACL